MAKQRRSFCFLYEGMESEVSLTRVRVVERYQVSILEKDKGFGHEMHKSEESEAVYGVTPLKDYAVTYSTKDMSIRSLRRECGMTEKCNRIIGSEMVREMLQVCPKLPNQQFEEPPFEEEIQTFLRDLGHSGEIKVITDVNVNKLHQPWRSFVAVINKCLSVIMESLVKKKQKGAILELKRRHLKNTIFCTYRYDVSAPAQHKKRVMINSRSGVSTTTNTPYAQMFISQRYAFNMIDELRDNTFSGSEQEDANEHIEKVLDIVDLFHIPKVTQDQIMLRAFLFLNKYCPPARTTKKKKEINNFQQEPDESLFRAWERFKELLMKCPQHYLTDMQEVILFYNGLDVPTRQILDSKGVLPSKTIAQLNNLKREIKKVNEKVYAAQVGCELCKGPHYTKNCPQKEEGKTLEEAYYIQFGAPYQPRGQYRVAGLGFYQRNNGNSLYLARRETMEELLAKFMAESANRQEENSNIIKEIQASTDVVIRNQGASIKTLELQIAQMSKLLQERGFKSLTGFTETNLKDQVKSISIVTVDLSEIRRMEHGLYVVSGSQHIFMFPETVPFPRQLHNYSCDGLKEAHGANILDAYYDILP
ncbi:hypothetical protein Tco_0067572 [Tanacetum coccineum]